MKTLFTLLFALLVSLLPMISLAEAAAAWAYAALPMNSEANGIGTIFFAASRFTPASVNPATCAAYTEEEIAAIVGGAAEGAEGYRFDVPAGALAGISAFGSDVLFWYDAENTAAIVSHADPLSLNAETGALTTAEGVVVASPMSI